MWNDWDSTAEHQMPKKYVHGHLVLSWKKINVHVKQTTKTFFRGTKTSYKQILHNGEYEMLALGWYQNIVYLRRL
jgi:hypothetical protein